MARIQQALPPQSKEERNSHPDLQFPLQTSDASQAKEVENASRSFDPSATVERWTGIFSELFKSDSSHAKLLGALQENTSQTLEPQEMGCAYAAFCVLMLSKFKGAVKKRKGKERFLVVLSDLSKMPVLKEGLALTMPGYTLVTSVIYSALEFVPTMKSVAEFDKSPDSELAYQVLGHCKEQLLQRCPREHLPEAICRLEIEIHKRGYPA